MTKAQQAILSVLHASGEHMTVDEIFTAVKKEIPSVSLGTVYRNLNHFADEKKIRRVRRANAPDFFEMNMTPHDHLVCTNCGKISDVSISGLKDYIEQQIGIDILSVDMTASYFCPECRRRNA